MEKDEKLMKRMLAKFRDSNYKLTSQRQDILDVLVDNYGEHFSAEELYEKVKEINPDIGLATVYRTLELMCQLGITHQVDFDSTYNRYEISLEGRHHHHLICIECGKIIEFSDKALESFERKLESDYQFEIVEHRIKFYGICNRCKQNR